LKHQPLTPTADAAVQYVRNALECNGWRVDVRATRARVNIDLSHDLTTPTVIGFAHDSSDHLEFVKQALNDHEFILIAQRPSKVVHAPLIARLREVAQANQWSEAVLVVIAEVLGSQGVLSRDEAQWLKRAGATWSGKRVSVAHSG
jgi:hypothetical protein